MPAIRVLVVDDDPDLCLLLQNHLIRLGYEVETVLSGELAWDAVQTRQPFAVFLIDLNLAATTGGDFFERLSEIQPLARLLLTSGQPQHRSAAGHTGERIAFLPKPFSPKQLTLELEKLTQGMIPP